MSTKPTPQVRIDAVLQKALQYHQASDLLRAKELYLYILGEDPDQATVLYLLGMIAFDEGDPQKAVDLIRKSLARDGRNIEAYVHLALIYQQCGEPEQALRLLQQGAVHNPTSVEILYNLSKAYIAGEKTEEAIDCLCRINSLHSGIAEIHHTLGLLYFKKKRIKKAIESFRSAIAIKPEDPQLYKNLAMAFLELPDQGEAIDALHKAIELTPIYAEAYALLGTTYRRQGQFDKALEVFLRLRDVCPREVRYLNDIGLIHLAQGKLEEAAEYFLQVVSANDDTAASAYFNLGLVYQKQQRLMESIKAYSQALSLDPDNGAAYNNLGMVYSLLDEKEMSRQCYAKTVELDPDNQAARHILDALNGTTTQTAPKDYIVSLFDQYSAQFEHDLVNNLDYFVPSKLKQALVDHVGQDVNFDNAIDLGCGTGMCGEEFRELTQRITGVDLSGKMLEKAHGKKIYDKLIQADVVEFLANSEEKFDLFISTDVFIYIGKLEPVFDMVRQRSLPGGYFIFSVESCENAFDYILCFSGRYAQSSSYIEAMARGYGFTVEASQPTGIRKENERWIMGELYILRFAGMQDSRKTVAPLATKVIMPQTIPYWHVR